MYSPSVELPDHSRIWIYQSDRELTSEEVDKISASAKQFLESWTAHDAKLQAGFEIRYSRFLILMIDEKVAGASGCSIDKSVHFVQGLEKEFNVSFFDRLKFAYRANDRVEVAPRTIFERKLAEGTLSGDTIVFNNLIQTKAELTSKWEVPLIKSWHRSLLNAY